MPVFTVKVIETSALEVQISAESAKEAESKACSMYYSGDLMMDEGDVSTEFLSSNWTDTLVEITWCLEDIRCEIEEKYTNLEPIEENCRKIAVS